MDWINRVDDRYAVLVKDIYEWVLNEIDPRSSDWFLMTTPLYPLLVDLVYLYFAFRLAPRIFRSHQILNVRTIISSYNTLILLINLILAGCFSFYIFLGGYSLKCQRVNAVGGEVEDKIAGLMWYFHLSKIIELSDTVFIVVKKNINQLTFLHLYHHSTIVIATWIGVKFVPGGSSAIIAMINSWVHVFMYFYYKFSVLGIPRTFSYKKFVTIMQISQFLLTITICITTINSRCGYPLWISYWLLLYIISFLVLFIRFFMKTYHPQPQPVRVEEEVEAED